VRVVLEDQQGVLVGRLEGDDSFDSTNCSDVKMMVVTRVAEGSDLVVDLSGVRFIDSAGVGALVSMLKAVRRAGRRMVLAGVTPPVLSILEIIRLTVIFEIRPGVPDALGYLRN
jgi:anti-sigma B factor antagonist